MVIHKIHDQVWEFSMSISTQQAYDENGSVSAQ
jgi:hypothetical protein